MAKEYYTIKEIEKLTGLSSYMIDYLCRQKLVTPSAMGSNKRSRGKQRKFTFANVVHFKTYSRLLANGVSVKRLKDACGTFQRYFGSIDGNIPSKRFLITDGESVYLRTSEDIVSELNNEAQFAFKFIVDLQHISDEIKKDEIKKFTTSS